MNQFPTKNTHVTSALPGPPYFSCAPKSHLLTQTVGASHGGSSGLSRGQVDPGRKVNKPQRLGKGEEKAQSQAM